MGTSTRSIFRSSLVLSLVVSLGPVIFGALVAMLIIASRNFPSLGIAISWAIVVLFARIVVELTFPAQTSQIKNAFTIGLVAIAKGIRWIKNFLHEEFATGYHEEESGTKVNDGFGSSYPLPIFEQAEEQINME